MVLPLRQPITDGTFILPLFEPKNPSKQDAETLQPPPGSSSLLPSALQHQGQCLQAIHKTIQQFHQNLKSEELDRKTLQFINLRLQNDFALLRYLLFSEVGTIPISSPLPVHQLTLTLLQTHFCFPALLNLQFVVLSRKVLWDHPERKETTLQTPTFSLQPTHRKLLQLRLST